VVASSLDDRPIDRALFAAFAELVRAGSNGPVADIGCGPGRVTILLSRLGLDAFGIDLSPGMLALARRTYPQLRFEEGSTPTPVSLDWYRQQPDEVADLLREAGFELSLTAVREREGTEKTTQGYLMARKPRP
jgi:trans-aconitate methyltransferase